MIVRGSHRIPGRPEEVYSLLQDRAVLEQAIPGCKELTPAGEDRYAIKMNVALAALTGDFQGTVQLADHEPPARFRLRVDANGRLGFLKGEGLLTLRPQDGETEVTYDGQAHIGGTMAAVGQRLLDATSKMMIRMFFERIASRACQSGTPPL
jgi:carbon monoxide dehydrogenase subunit G